MTPIDPKATRDGSLPVPPRVAPTRDGPLPTPRAGETRESFQAPGAPQTKETLHDQLQSRLPVNSRMTNPNRPRVGAPSDRVPDPLFKMFKAIRDVVNDGAMIVRHPKDFYVRLGIDDADMFARGTRFMLSSVPALFVLLLPVHIIHGRSVTQGFVGLMFTVSVYMTAPLVHYMLRLMGARRVPLSTTIGLYAFQGCAQLLVYVALAYPIALRFGSKVFFGTQQEIADLVKLATPNDAIFFTLTWLFSFGFTLVWFAFGWTPLFARYYALRKPSWLRAFAALFLPSVLTSYVYAWLIPIFRKISDAM